MKENAAMLSEAENAYIEAAKAMYRFTGLMVYIYSMKRGRFLYMSDHPYVLLGHQALSVVDWDEERKRFFVPEEDRQMLAQVIQSMRNNSLRLDAEQLASLVMYVDVHHRQRVPQGQKEVWREVLVGFRVTPLDSWRDLLLGVGAPSVHRDGPAAYLKLSHTGTFYRFDRARGEWEAEVYLQLTECEVEMLRLSSKGMGQKEIAMWMNKSVDAVRDYRRSVFCKMDVTSITEAVAYAGYYGLL